MVNFFVHYEIDDDTSHHVLKLDRGVRRREHQLVGAAGGGRARGGGVTVTYIRYTYIRYRNYQVLRMSEKLRNDPAVRQRAKKTGYWKFPVFLMVSRECIIL